MLYRIADFKLFTIGVKDFLIAPLFQILVCLLHLGCVLLEVIMWS